MARRRNEKIKCVGCRAMTDRVKYCDSCAPLFANHLLPPEQSILKSKNKIWFVGDQECVLI